MPVTGKIQIEGGLFQSFEGTPLANGYLLLQLSHDEQETVDPGLVTGAPKIKIALDSNGNIPSSPAVMIWPNDQLLPSGSEYEVWGYASDGTLVFGPQFWILTSAVSPYNVANQTPTNPPGSGVGSSGQSVVLETNGTQNSNQALLNLAAGTNITLSNTSGTTTINATGASFSGNSAFMFGPGILDLGTVFLTTAAPLANSVNGTSTANQVVVYFFELTVEITISKVSTYCTNNGIGPTASFGIYSFAGNKLVDGGSFTTLNSAGVQTNSITPVTLQPGTYFHAQACSTNTSAATFVGFICPSSTGAAAMLVKHATRVATAANPMAGGVLPATLGTLTPFTPISGDGDGVCCPFYE